jgi:thiol:disulfide interchange protein DsbD
MLAIGAGVYLGALDFSPRKGWGQLWKTMGAFAFVYGVLLLIGAASGARDPLQPLSEFAHSGAPSSAVDQPAWRKVRGVAGLEAELASATAAGSPVVLDFYADWCISCKVMERTVFSDPDVAAQLNQFVLLQADVTANDADDQALLQHFGLYGPPSMLFFDTAGDELAALRMQGEMDRDTFARHIARVVAAT